MTQERNMSPKTSTGRKNNIWVHQNILLSARNLKMTTFVRKKLQGDKIQRFLHEIQEEDATTLTWKKGPCMNNTKFKDVRITHLHGKETLMLQGPKDTVTTLSERFKATMREDVVKLGSTANNCEMENCVTIAKSRIEDLILFVRCWENQQTRIDEANTSGKSQETQQRWSQPHGMDENRGGCENNDVRSFNRDISQYLRANGFIPRKGKGSTSQGRSTRF